MTQHGGGASRNKIFPAAKPCDYCNSAAALIFCLADSAFVCMSCDTKLHNTNHKHKRVWMCDVCEQAPAAFNCKADAATLCVTCDRDIHSANPLARRHDRTAVVPFYDTAESMVIKSIPPTSHDHLVVDDTFSVPTNESCDHMIPGLSMSISSNTNINVNTSKLTEDFMFSDSDHYLDQISSHPYSDSIVPEQTTFKLPIQTHFITPESDHQSEINRFEIDFTKSNMNSYNSYTTLSLISHNISSSSMDVGIVPDGSAHAHAMSDISYPFPRNINSTIDNIPVVGMDREARVLRYKEKRKNRKFEKTIRYASRKAYAETRPRIKGRFAKRIDSEADMDQIFGSGSANFMADSRFGIVPSFSFV